LLEIHNRLQFNIQSTMAKMLIFYKNKLYSTRGEHNGKGGRNMALFRNPAFEELEDIYIKGKTFGTGNLQFTLTLRSIEPFPQRLLEYDWNVKLVNGVEIQAYMGEGVLSPDGTRLRDIHRKLREYAASLPVEELAKNIDHTIQEIVNNFRNSDRNPTDSDL
jgi:hypothetical protein